jgi:hypothetical protein
LSLPYGSWRKDQYVSTTDLKRAIKFSSQQNALLTLIVHDLDSVGKKIGQKMEKGHYTNSGWFGA